MSPDERRAYIRRIVDAAPALSAEDADYVRTLMPLSGRTTARNQMPQRGAQQTHSRTAAA